ncbi:MAG: inositol-3-phosphate synthase [Planctomycetota bacterium]
MSKIGVCIIGSAGAVATTVVAGTYLMRKGLAPKRGMITEKDPLFTKNVLPDLLKMPTLDEFVFGGWDMHDVTYYDAVREHGVVPKALADQIKDELSVKPWPAAVSQKFVVNLSGKNVIAAKTFREETQIIQKQIEDWKAANGLDRVVMVNLASTERYIEAGDVHATPEAFEKGLDASDERISPGMKYFYVAVKMGIPHCNFAPSLCRIPALETIAQQTGTPYCGMDGKTGQTLLKTTLAGMFRLRNIKVEGWYSANFLGNRDGLVLDDPGSNKTKIVSKASVLDSVVGYKVENHQVHIHYYKPRGDAKEAWDNIDIEGFIGEMMQMKVNFLCKDSILAAPLVIDMVRLIDIAKQKGEKGIQRQLSLFFKSPYADKGETPIHETFKQEDLLYAWVNKHKG